MKRESALARYARSLTSSGHNYKINTELFGTIDTKKLVKELALEKRGNEDGKNNLPSARSSAPTAAEASIKEQIDSAKKYAHTLAEDNIYTYNERISSRNFDKQITETKKLSSEAIMEFRADVNKCVADMHEKRRDLKDIENEIKVFRNRNGLRESTSYMTSTPWQILKILIILILVIIETAFNGVYLAEGNEQGLLGGTTYAVSIGTINIGFACILSFFGVKHLFFM